MTDEAPDPQDQPPGDTAPQAAGHDPASALEALAAGVDTEPDAADDPVTDESTDAFAAVADDPTDPAAALSAAPVADLTDAAADADGRAARLARARTQRAQAAHVHAYQFKHFMVPMLLATGGLLIVVGLVILVRIANGARFVASWISESAVKIMAWAALPLGLILLLGAWLFYRELQQARNKRR